MMNTVMAMQFARELLAICNDILFYVLLCGFGHDVHLFLISGPSSVNDDAPPHRVITSPPAEGPRAPFRSPPQPPNTPAPTRRSLLPPPRSSPVGKCIKPSFTFTPPSFSTVKRICVVH